jgi:hypothetical protein
MGIEIKLTGRSPARDEFGGEGIRSIRLSSAERAQSGSLRQRELNPALFGRESSIRLSSAERAQSGSLQERKRRKVE